MSDWSTDDVAQVLLALEFTLARQKSHDTYTRAGHPRTVSVPRGRKTIAKGTVGSIWRQAGITSKAAEAIRRGEEP